MTKISFVLKPEQSEKIVEGLKKTSINLEKKLNDYLHIKGSQMVVQSIIGFMPRSDRSKKGGHAKDRKSLRTKDFNLGFEISPKPKYKYLVFPDQGIGKNNLISQEFFQKGLDSKQDKLFKDVFNIINENIQIWKE